MARFTMGFQKVAGLAEDIAKLPSRVHWSGPSRKFGVSPKALKGAEPSKVSSKIHEAKKVSGSK